MGKEINKVLNSIYSFDEKVGLQNLESHSVELALNDDLRKAENDLKSALLKYSAIEKEYQNAKKDLKTQSDKAYDIALKFNFNANDLGLDALKNPFYKAIDTYLNSPLIKELK